jgi:hypothetical protein
VITVRVTINLARGSGQRELVEVLRAADAVKPARRSSLNPLDFLTAVIHVALTQVLKRLEGMIRLSVCSYVTCRRGARLNNRRRELQQELLAWLRITPGRVAVKP